MVFFHFHSTILHTISSQRINLRVYLPHGMNAGSGFLKARLASWKCVVLYYLLIGVLLCSLSLLLGNVDVLLWLNLQICIFVIINFIIAFYLCRLSHLNLIGLIYFSMALYGQAVWIYVGFRSFLLICVVFSELFFFHHLFCVRNFLLSFWTSNCLPRFRGAIFCSRC